MDKAEVLSAFGEDRTDTLASVAGAIDTSPDETAEAIDLEKSFGVPAPAILADMEGFKRNQKIRLATDVTANNKRISDWMMSNAMAAQLSHDDLGQLDAISEQLDKWPKRGLLATGAAGFRAAAQRDVSVMTDAFKSGFDVESFNSEMGRFLTYSDNPAYKAFAYTVWPFAGILDASMRGFTGAMYAAGALVGETAKDLGMNEAMANRGARDTVMGLQVLLSGQGIFRAPVAPGVKAAERQAKRANKPLPWSYTGKAYEPWFREGREPLPGIDAKIDAIKAEQNVADIKLLNDALGKVTKSLTRERNPDMFADFIRKHETGDIYVSVDKIQELYGEKLPTPDDGILGWVPDIERQLQTAIATGGDVRIPLADYLAKVDKEVHKQIEDGIRTREGNLTAEEGKVLPKLEESIAPLPDDLTMEYSHTAYDIMDMQKQSRLLEFKDDQGRTVFKATLNRYADDSFQVNHIVNDSKWLSQTTDIKRRTNLGERAYVELAKKVQEEGKKLVIGASGETSQYAKNIHQRLEEKGYASKPNEYGIREVYPEPRIEVIDQIRQAAGLKPVEELTLRREDKVGEAHAFSFRDAEGKDVGEIFIAEEQGGKVLYVDDIRGQGPNSFGPRAMRSLLEQIKAEFPNAEMIKGDRVSGARWAAGTGGGIADIDLTKIKPRQKAEPPKELPLEPSGKPTTRAKQLELDVTRIEDRPLFDRAAAIGMTVEQYKLFQKNIEKIRADDAAKAQERALEDARRRQSAEWKERQAEMRPQIVQEVDARPDVAVDRFMREGDPDAPVGTAKPRLAEELLTEEQKAALPKEWVKKDGMHPDDVAVMFGYPDSASMIADVAELVADRKQTGLRPSEYHRRLISTELEKRMEEKYGKLSKNIIDDAIDHVLSETQLDLLAEEVLAMGTQAGAELTIKTAELKAWIAERTAESPLRMITTERLLADAGKAGRLVEMALLKGDPAEAFVQKQRQFIAVSMAKEARQLEKDAARLDKLAERFSKREVKNVEQDATAHIQNLLKQAGYKVRLTEKEIAEGIEFSGHATLEEWVTDKAGIGWEPAVAPDLFLGAKTLDQMSVAEFRDFRDAITSMAYIGRQEFKINKLGEQIEFQAFRDDVRANLEQMKPRSRDSQGRWLYQTDAMLTRMEEIIKDLDLRQELGPLFTTVIEPMMRSKTKEFDMLQELSNHFKKVRGDFGRRWRHTLKDTIPNDFLMDPYSNTLYDLSRENLINIMLNWGNRSNIEKFTRGYASVELGRKATREEAAAFEIRVKDMIDRHATADDWKFVQAMWAPFKKWQKEADTVSRNVSGVAPKWIDPTVVDTPHGQFEGGYWPVKYDRLSSNISVIEDKPRGGAVFGPDYFRAATAKSYLKERTGYVDFVDIESSIEQAAGVMQQTIHDISFRDSLMQAGKIFYDKEIRGMIRKHYGVEYEEQLVPWLKRIANKNTVDSVAIRGATRFFRRLRINLVGHALPLNLRVILSPDVGVPNPRTWLAFEANREANVKLAMEKSNEIRHLVYNMDRDFREQLESITTKRGWHTYQQQAAQWGFLPAMKVSQEFRMATFVDQYSRAKERGLTDHEAAVVADGYVRERHGAASVVDLPAMMEQGEAWKWATLFYGYFNTMYNWQRQIPGDIRRGQYGKASVAALGTIGVGAFFNATLFNRAKKDESWFTHISKAILTMPLSTVPGLRDLTALAFEGHEARRPDISLAKALVILGNDAYNALIKGKTINKPISHTANVIGMSTGLPLANPGRTGQFFYDIKRGKQNPKNIIEWMKGIIHGEPYPKR